MTARLVFDEHCTVLILSHQRQRVEVRGQLDVSPDDPLQQVIDRLPGPLVGGELMAGNTAGINERMYSDALGVLLSLFEEE